MPPKRNPLHLNPLQLKTLTLLQELARLAGKPAAAEDGDPGSLAIAEFPHAHGDHFHLGDASVSAADATGLENENVWNALSRKGLIRCEWPNQIALTPAGVAYETGIADQILHRGGHH